MPPANKNPLAALSQAMTAVVSTASLFTVLVQTRRQSPATGVAYAPDLILTADHVIEPSDNITVTLPDSTEVNAVLAGREPASDLALLRLEKGCATPAQPAAGAAQVGQVVLALGRPTAAGIQASLGIVTAIGGPLRTAQGVLVEQFLRTDVVPYPGFSGGPLVDAEGAVLGINTVALARGDLLTIPAGIAWQAAAALAQHGRVRRGYLGIRSQPVELSEAAQKELHRRQAAGLLLVGVEEDSPAESAGLSVGDILVGISGQAVTHPDELLSRLTGEVAGKPVVVEILRGGELRTMTVIVGER